MSPFHAPFHRAGRGVVISLSLGLQNDYHGPPVLCNDLANFLVEDVFCF